MSRNALIWGCCVLAASLTFVSGCDAGNSTASGGSLALQQVQCETSQDCLDAVLAYAPNSGAVLSDHVCLRPAPNVVQGHCDFASSMVACPESGCGCRACVKRVELLCDNCGTATTCLPVSYCSGLSPGDCDPPTLGSDLCGPFQSGDVSTTD